MLTPMVDVVFLLLVFFLMTFKLVAPEGDLQVKMPQTAASSPPTPHDALPIPVRLRATADGELAEIRLGDRSLTNDFGALRAEIRRLTGDGLTPARQTRVRLDCDYQLRYEYLVAAITAVPGCVELAPSRGPHPELPRNRAPRR
jgi:biopolymer transport protein ExbD